jgi:hypothetical protein
MTFSSLARARVRYAQIRRSAYALAVMDAVRQGGVHPSLRLTDIDAEALSVWKATWRGTHLSGAGGWDWEVIWCRFRKRPTAFQLAIWSGGQLCGLAIGRTSKRRSSGVRHTISIHYMEAAPDQRHPLAGTIAPLAIAAAQRYGEALGASRLRLMDPLPGASTYYRKLGLSIALLPGRGVYFEKRIPR